MFKRVVLSVVLVSVLLSLLAPVCFAGGPPRNNQGKGLPAWVAKAQQRVEVVSKHFKAMPSGPSKGLQAGYDVLFKVAEPHTNMGPGK